MSGVPWRNGDEMPENLRTIVVFFGDPFEVALAYRNGDLLERIDAGGRLTYRWQIVRFWLYFHELEATLPKPSPQAQGPRIMSNELQTVNIVFHYESALGDELLSSLRLIAERMREAGGTPKMTLSLTGQAPPAFIESVAKSLRSLTAIEGVTIEETTRLDSPVPKSC